MKTLVRSFLNEPRPPHAPRRVWRDWLLVAAIAATTIGEQIGRSDPASLILVGPITAVLIGAMLWRRTEPLIASATAFGSVMLVDTIALIAGRDPSDLYGSAWILILGYALFRWGSGHEIAIGFGVVVATFVVGTIGSYTGVGDAVGGGIVLLFPLALGAYVRENSRSRAQQTERIKLEERAQIARELHDTVAHHVSAIAVQAQAGRFLASSDSLEGATEALVTIEEEAARTLDEMRSMIGVLRGGTPDADVAVHHDLADLDRFGRDATATTPRVTIERSGDLASIADPVASAIFRLAQESITNATRHARRATFIEVTVHGEPTTVSITVVDDGDTAVGGSHTHGFGLVGMAERVNLLGGTFRAGPATGDGWVVRAELPKSPSTR